MSEFYPTTLCTLYTTEVPFSDYDTVDHSNETIAATGVPVQILTNRINQDYPVDMRSTTSKTYSARIRGHVHLEWTYRLLDEWTGERYMIDTMDKPQNPMGDDSWVLVLRKVPPKPGQ